MRYAVNVAIRFIVEANSEEEAVNIGRWIAEGIPSTSDAEVDGIEVVSAGED